MAEMTIRENTRIAQDAYRLTLALDESCAYRPGQFYQLRVPGYYLRRPISLCDWDETSVTLVYKVIGVGTKDMSAWTAGARVDALGPLGNGFSLDDAFDRPLLIGGGMGVAPLVGLARTMRKRHMSPVAALGFQSAKDAILLDAFARLGVETLVATEDGSLGTRGYVTSLFERISFDAIFACGPMPMLEAVAARTQAPAQFSLEARMGCGFGACMGCSINTRDGALRVCKDGPVFQKEALLWPTRA